MNISNMHEFYKMMEEVEELEKESRKKGLVLLSKLEEEPDKIGNTAKIRFLRLSLRLDT